MRRQLFGRACVIGASALFACGATGAWAQQNRPQASSVQIDEIIVTAQKRAERLEDVPISITAMSGPVMEKSGINNIQDLGQISVGVHLGHFATFVQPTIRGVSATQVTGTLANNVGIYVDGYYAASAYSLNQDLVSIANVQILKGPQGTLFGRNTTGGAMLVDTLDPDLTKPGGRVQLGYGTFDEKIGQIYITAPLVQDKLAFNIAAYRRWSDGYVTDIGGVAPKHAAPINMQTIRTKLLWQVTDDFKATFLLNYADNSDPTPSARTYFRNNLTAFEFPGTIYATEPYEVSMSFRTQTRDLARQIGLKLEYDLGWATLKSLAQYQVESLTLLQDNDGTPLPKIALRSVNYFRYASEELNLSRTSEKFDWVLGGFYMGFWNRNRSDGTRPLVVGPPIVPGAFVPSPGPTPSTFQKAMYRTAAVFFDGTYRITDRLAFIGGLRYSYERPGITVQRPTSSADPTSTSYLPNPTIRTTFESVIPRAVLRYEIADNTNVYGSYSKGFKSGGYAGSAGVPRNALGQPGNFPVKPEKSTVFEVGFKTAQPTWRLNASAFYNTYKDQQVAVVIAVQSQGAFSQLFIPFNAASSHIYGVEVEASWAPMENLNLRAGVGYLHARYNKFTNAQSFTSCPNPLVNCVDATLTPSRTVPPGYNASNQVSVDLSGKRMLRSPDWSLNGGFDYTIPSAMGEVVLSGNASYQTKFNEHDLSVYPGTTDYRNTSPGYELINGQIAWTPYDGPVTLTVWGRNLTDSLFYMYLAPTAGGDALIGAQPRTYGVTLDYRF